MEFTPLGIEGLWLAESPIWRDNRGLFQEWFKHEELVKVIGLDFTVKQANVSSSNKGVIRGIHYSLIPEGQSKWVTCLSGAVMDVIVDIRPKSATFGKIEYIDLKGSDGRAIFIGSGLGHGFISLEDQTLISYLLSSPYSPEHEFEIHPTDPQLEIDWHLELLNGVNFLLSPKDANAPTMEQRRLEGKLP